MHSLEIKVSEKQVTIQTYPAAYNTKQGFSLMHKRADIIEA